MESNSKSRDGVVVAVSISAGGVPKLPIEQGEVTPQGIIGDVHAHAKHNRPDRAISLLDIEIMHELVREGFPLLPGTAGENLTIEGLNVQQMDQGTLLEIGDVVLRLETPRKPCYVLDVIDPRLKDVIVGRCGYMASVVRSGTVTAGMAIRAVT
jgi:MOSC domain-containing protein YiiM